MIDCTDVQFALTYDFFTLINNNGNYLGHIISFDKGGSEETYWEQIEIDYNLYELPQYPAVLVNEIERVKIKIIQYDLPIVLCRDDFPVVPHLNISDAGEKSLCLFDVPFQEIQYTFNASMLLSRISNWFVKTSRGELHQRNQGLEPFFPSVKNKIIVDVSNRLSPIIKLKEINTETGKIFIEKPLFSSEKDPIFIRIQVNITKTYSDNVIRKLPKNLLELDAAFDDDIIKLIEDSVNSIWTIRQNPKIFIDVFNQSRGALESCKLLLFVKVSLIRSNETKIEQPSIKIFYIETNYKSLFQIFVYIIEKNKLVKKNLRSDLSRVKLIPYEVFYNLNQIGAQRLNGLEEKECNRTFFQVGLGALGSQIANNCFRAGYGRWILMDDDILYPHNLARHCLSSEYVGSNKVESMKDYSEKILNENGENIVDKYLNINLFDKTQTKLILEEIAKSDMIIDTTASIAAERYLSSELAGKRRCVCFFMNPRGTSLVMLLEDQEREITLDLLEMQYYRLLITEQKFARHLENNEKVIYSTSCRSRSLKISQDNMALSAAICSKAIKCSKENTSALIAIWTMDNLTVDNHIVPAEKFRMIGCEKWKIMISESIYLKIFELRKQKLPSETGGVLIGTHDFERKICYIVSIVESPDDSIESPSSYIRGSKGLLSHIKNIDVMTDGNIGYIGEWHSHPNNCTIQSSDDKILMGKISEYTGQQSCPGWMVIVGENHLSIYTK